MSRRHCRKRSTDEDDTAFFQRLTGEDFRLIDRECDEHWAGRRREDCHKRLRYEDDKDLLKNLTPEECRQIDTPCKEYWAGRERLGCCKSLNFDGPRPQQVEAADKLARTVDEKLLSTKPPGCPQLRLETISWAPPAHGIVMCELFGGIGTGIEAALETGVRIKSYVYCDKDGTARKILRARCKQLLERYPEQLTQETFSGALNTFPHDMEQITPHHLRSLGQMDLLVAGWECQGFSPAGKKKGLDDPRSALFLKLVQVLAWAQELYPNVAFVLENTHHDLGDENLREHILLVQSHVGKPFVIDAAQVNSYAHRLRDFWTNLAPLIKLELALHQTKRRPDMQVNDILGPGRLTRRVYAGEKRTYPYYAANSPDKPRSVLPTLVAYRGSSPFQAQGPGSIFNRTTKQWNPPTVRDCELAMGFQADTTEAPGVTEWYRCQALGKAIDLNTLVWILRHGFAFNIRQGTSC